MVYVLDTDHVSLMQSGHAACLSRLDMIETDPVIITVVTVEERVQGWFNAVRQASAPNRADRLVWAYAGLRDSVQYLNQFQVADWTEDSGRCFTDLRGQGVRIGTQDLRIASIALSIDAVVVTRNRKDFVQVPGLRIDDWSS
jgi:tRNA(fMet)-specific endonuclease VapC